jgi:hypothetical protein
MGSTELSISFEEENWFYVACCTKRRDLVLYEVHGEQDIPRTAGNSIGVQTKPTRNKRLISGQFPLIERQNLLHTMKCKRG